MKKILFVFALLLYFINGFSQEMEKIKGSELIVNKKDGDKLRVYETGNQFYIVANIPINMPGVTIENADSLGHKEAGAYLLKADSTIYTSLWQLLDTLKKYYVIDSLYKKSETDVLLVAKFNNSDSNKYSGKGYLQTQIADFLDSLTINGKISDSVAANIVEFLDSTLIDKKISDSISFNLLAHWDTVEIIAKGYLIGNDTLNLRADIDLKLNISDTSVFYRKIVIDNLLVAKFDNSDSNKYAGKGYLQTQIVGFLDSLVINQKISDSIANNIIEFLDSVIINQKISDSITANLLSYMDSTETMDSIAAAGGGGIEPDGSATYIQVVDIDTTKLKGNANFTYDGTTFNIGGTNSVFNNNGNWSTVGNVGVGITNIAAFKVVIKGGAGKTNLTTYNRDDQKGLSIMEYGEINGYNYATGIRRITFYSADGDMYWYDATGAQNGFISSHTDSYIKGGEFGFGTSVIAASVHVKSTDNTDGTDGFRLDDVNGNKLFTITSAGTGNAYGDFYFRGMVNIDTAFIFIDSDVTPDISGHTNWETNTSAATITDFDGDKTEGNIIVVESKGAITYDVTASGIEGGTIDIITATGDETGFKYNGTKWKVLWRMDMSDDLN